MTEVSRADRMLLALASVLVYARHPRLAERYHKKQGRWANFAMPETLSELVQWRKVFDRNPLFPILTDKLAAKHWAAERLDDIEAPETLWVGERPEDIPAALVNPGVVIKTNNSCGQNLFPHRGNIDHGDAIRRLRRWMPGPFVAWLRRVAAGKVEWAYIPIHRKVFVEHRIVAGGGRKLVDISIRASDGKPFAVSCATDFKTGGSRLGYFSPQGARAVGMDLGERNAELPDDFVFPSAMPRALAAAARVSQGVDYLRVDFLADEDRLYLGEITVYPASGYGADDGRAVQIYGHWLAAIEKSWFLSTPQPWPLSLYAGAFRRWARRRNAELAVATAVVPAPTR